MSIPPDRGLPPYGIRGLDDAPRRADPEASRPWFARLRAGRRNGLESSQWAPRRTSRRGGGATHVRVGSICFGSKSGRALATSGRTLVYFGIAEEDDDWEDEDGFAAEESLEQSYRERPNVRRLTPRRRSQDFDDWTESESDQPTSRTPAVRQSARVREMRPQIEAVPNPSSVRVHLVLPRSFNDAQQIADKFKQGIPVILNLQGPTPSSQRLIDFASGLTYALNGGMQRVADRFPADTAKRRGPPSSAQRCSSAAVFQPGVKPTLRQKDAAWCCSTQ